MTKITYIPGEIANAAIDEYGNRKPVTRTQHIFDDDKGKNQEQINQETDENISNTNAGIVREQDRAVSAEEALANRTYALEELAEISVGGGDIQISNTSEDIQPGNAKVATGNALAELYGYVIENPEFVHVYTDYNNHILWAIRADGTIYYGAGVPPQIIDYINSKVEEITENLDIVSDKVTEIVSFLDGFDTETLLEYLNKTYGEYVENSEYLYAIVDNKLKILFGVKSNGNSVFGGNVKIYGDLELSNIPKDILDAIDAEIENNTGQSFNNNTPPEIVTQDYTIEHGTIAAPTSVKNVSSPQDFTPGTELLNILKDMAIQVNGEEVENLYVNGNGHKLLFYSRKINSFTVVNGKKEASINNIDISAVEYWADENLNIIKQSCTDPLQTNDNIRDTSWNIIQDSVASPYSGEFWVPLPKGFDLSSIDVTNALISISQPFVRHNYRVLDKAIHNDTPYLKCTNAGYNNRYSLYEEYRVLKIFPSVTVYNCYPDDVSTIYIDAANGKVRVPLHINTLYIRETKGFILIGNAHVYNADIVGCYRGALNWGQPSAPEPLFATDAEAVCKFDNLHVCGSDCFTSGKGDVVVTHSVFEDSMLNVISQTVDYFEEETDGKLTIEHCKFIKTSYFGTNSNTIIARQLSHIHHCDFVDYGYSAISVGYLVGSNGTAIVGAYSKSRSCIEHNNIYFSKDYSQHIAKKLVPYDGGPIYVSTINELCVVRYNNIQSYVNRGMGSGVVGIYFDDGAPNVYAFNNFVHNISKGYTAISMRYSVGRSYPEGMLLNVNKYCGFNVVDGNILVGADENDTVSKIESNLMLKKHLTLLQTGGHPFRNVEQPIKINGDAYETGFESGKLDCKPITFVDSPWI